MRYILGIDQGGTKTAAAICDDTGKILGEGIEKGAYYPSDEEDAFSKIARAVAEAEEKAGISRDDIDIAIAGVTGIDWPGNEEYVSEKLKKLLGVPELYAYNDAVIALYCGPEDGCDLVLCAGPGMNAAVNIGKNRYYVFGDYMEESMQGGRARARRAIRKVFDAEAGLGEETALKKLFLTFAGESSVDRLLYRYMMEKGFDSEIRFLVPDILKTAKAGDVVASETVREFAERIAQYIHVGLKKCGSSKKKKTIVLAGGVFGGDENYLRELVISIVEKQNSDVQIILAEHSPVMGACRMGKKRILDKG